jgi:predicted outer membrane repeat protein
MPILLLGLVGFSTSQASALVPVIYVDVTASGDDNGSSWENAYIDLKSALLSAPSAGTQIWVADGTYKPTSGLTQSATFTLVNDVAVYGGFAGTETLLSERNPKTNITVLSGDIGVVSDTNDNVYHVVTSSGTGNSAVLDGFTITGGNAGGDRAIPFGGGINNVGGSPMLSNLVIMGNRGNYGGGMYSYNGASPVLTNITFSNNTADERAGGMYNNLNSNAVLTNVTFNNNTAGTRGGGMAVSGSTPTLTNVTFTGNVAQRGGAIQSAYSGNFTLMNVTISGNIGTIQGGGIYSEASIPVIINTIIYNNTGNAIDATTSTPVVTYSIVEGGYTGEGNLDVDPLLGTLQNNGGYTLTMALDPASEAIDAGTNTGCPSSDQRGVSRPQGTLCDIGAYEADIVAPETALNTFPSNPDSDTTPTFTFSGDDIGGTGVASFMCKIDSGSYSACTSPFTSSNLTAGEHTFSVYAIDNASNPDPSPASHSWTLEFDTTLVSSIVRADASPTSAASVNFTVTFSETVTGVDTGDFQLTTVGASGASITGVSGSDTTYTVSVNTGTTNGTIRLDIPASADIDDTLGNSPTNIPYTGGETYTINKTGTFLDVPNSHWAWRWIEGLSSAGVTSGCGGGNYCPTTPVTRDQMAVFLLKAKHGTSYSPPAASGLFLDVPTNHWAAAWIERLAAEGITSGCGGGNYCPGQPVTRDQMAVFLLKAKHGTSYSPPAASGVFLDVPTNYWAAAWIERLAAEGITGGCGGGNYCPATPVTRDQMAVFLLKTFNIPPLP